jgi:transposase
MAALAVALHQAGYAASVVNPAQVQAFARSLARRAKRDALDAQLLTLFACERQPRCWTPPEQIYHELRQQARNQRHALEQWPVHIQAALHALDKVVGAGRRRRNGNTSHIPT